MLSASSPEWLNGLLLACRQSAIAAKATQAVKGYFLGAFLFLAIIYCLPICLGTLALTLDIPVSCPQDDRPL